MTKTPFKFLLLLSAALIIGTGCVLAQSITTILDKPVNGTVTLVPALPADGKYPAGTLVTVTAKPDPG